MCTGLFITWKCGHKWRGWRRCDRAKEGDEKPPCQWTIVRAIEEHLEPKWCCLPQCCEREFAPIARKTQERKAKLDAMAGEQGVSRERGSQTKAVETNKATYMMRLREHMERCMPNLAAGRGMNNIMIRDMHALGLQVTLQPSDNQLPSVDYNLLSKARGSETRSYINRLQAGVASGVAGQVFWKSGEQQHQLLKEFRAGENEGHMPRMPIAPPPGDADSYGQTRPTFVAPLNWESAFAPGPEDWEVAPRAEDADGYGQTRPTFAAPSNWESAFAPGPEDWEAYNAEILAGRAQQGEEAYDEQASAELGEGTQRQVSTLVEWQQRRDAEELPQTLDGAYTGPRDRHGQPRHGNPYRPLAPAEKQD